MRHFQIVPPLRAAKAASSTYQGARAKGVRDAWSCNSDQQQSGHAGRQEYAPSCCKCLLLRNARSAALRATWATQPLWRCAMPLLLTKSSVRFTQAPWRLCVWGACVGDLVACRKPQEPAVEKSVGPSLPQDTTTSSRPKRGQASQPHTASHKAPKTSSTALPSQAARADALPASSTNNNHSSSSSRQQHQQTLLSSFLQPSRQHAAGSGSTATDGSVPSWQQAPSAQEVAAVRASKSALLDMVNQRRVL